MTTVLVTGASGYIGKHIVLQLLNQGYEVRASVRNPEKSSEVLEALRPHLTDPSKIESRLSFVELDLEQDSGWDDALRGVDVLIHTASPFPIASPKDENDLIRPAVEGTLRALRAASAQGVTQVILTSSNAAIYGSDLPAGKTEFDETMWTDVNHPIGRIAYTKSKTLAERAAWEFVAKNPSISLTTINPVLVLGAPLDKNFGSSISVIERILSGKDPLLPDLQFAIVDVRDVATMHVKAIGNEQTAGERFLAVAGTRSFIEIAKYLKSIYPQSKVKTGLAPTFLIRLLAFVDRDIKSILPMLGKPANSSGAKAQRVLGIDFIPVEVTVSETADYLIRSGFARA